MTGYRIVWPEAGRAELEEFELPVLKNRDVLVKNEYSLVSAGTERACLMSMPNTGQHFPQFPGYSVAGRVMETGKGVTEFAHGDRVIVYKGNHASHVIQDVCKVTKIEHDNVSTREASFMLIASMSLQGIRKARIELGESVLVIGLGLLGLFAVQLARLNGGFPVIASDFDEGRRLLAGKLGANHVFSPGDKNFTEALANVTEKRGADAIIEVTGAPEAMQQALDCISYRGRIILLGCTRQPVEKVDFYRHVHKTGVAIIGAHNHVRPKHDSSPGYWTMQDDLKLLLSLLASGRLQVKPIAMEEVSPRQAPMIYRRLAENSPGVMGVNFNWNT